MNTCRSNEPEQPESSTRYAPPVGRSEIEELTKLLAAVRAERLLPLVVESIPGPAAILNDQRQIVLVNDHLVRASGKTRAEEILGMRPGEALGCEEVARGPDGCGTSEACVLCGVANSLCESLNYPERPITRECRISLDRQGFSALEFEAVSSVTRVGDQSVHFFFLRDISGESRRRVFERTFFHDILNTAGGLRCLAEMMSQVDDVNEEQRLLLRVAEQLVEEIQFHRQLTSAESGELTCQLEDVSIKTLLDSVLGLYSKHSVARGRTIVIEGNLDFSIKTDRVILQRVLGNLAKNALEASPIGGSVRMSARIENNDVVLAIQNAGVMPKDVQLQLFKRSFSTKSKVGRGIGTYSVRLFVEQFLKGKVRFTTTQADGTTFFVTIPR